MINANLLIKVWSNIQTNNYKQCNVPHGYHMIIKRISTKISLYQPTTFQASMNTSYNISLILVIAIAVDYHRAEVTVAVHQTAIDFLIKHH